MVIVTVIAYLLADPPPMPVQTRLIWF